MEQDKFNAALKEFEAPEAETPEQDTSAPEQEQEAAEPEEKEQPEVKEDDAGKDEFDDHDDFLKGQKNVKSVPYDRFKKVNDARKQLMKRIAEELEPASKNYATLKGQYDGLISKLQSFDSRIQKQPWLMTALDKIMAAEEDGQIDLTEAYEALGQVVEAAMNKQSDPNGKPQADPIALKRIESLEKELGSFKESQEVAVYQARYAKDKDRIKSEIPKQFKNVDVDKEFMEDVMNTMSTMLDSTAISDAEKKKLSLYDAAVKVAQRQTKIIEGILKKQVSKQPAKDAAALENSDGLPGEEKLEIPPVGDPRRMEVLGKLGDKTL